MTNSAGRVAVVLFLIIVINAAINSVVVDAYTFQHQQHQQHAGSSSPLRSFARRSSLFMNIENEAYKENVRVGVIGKKKHQMTQETTSNDERRAHP